MEKAKEVWTLEENGSYRKTECLFYRKKRLVLRLPERVVELSLRKNGTWQEVGKPTRARTIAFPGTCNYYRYE